MHLPDVAALLLTYRSLLLVGHLEDTLKPDMIHLYLVFTIRIVSSGSSNFVCGLKQDGPLTGLTWATQN